MVKLYGDTADIAEMREMAKNPLIKGFTTNPTLARRAGVINYGQWAREVCSTFPEYPVSIEVLNDEFDEMERQARRIAGWGDNIYVKIPITNSRGELSRVLIESLARDGIKVNITAIMTITQVNWVQRALAPQFNTPAIISIFAGRIGDTGKNPIHTMSSAAQQPRNKLHEILWASPRQVLDVTLAESCDVDIITVSKEILAKMSLRHKNLTDYSRETVQMFLNDAQKACFEV